MSDLTQEQFESLPEFLTGQYEKVGEGESLVYRHSSEIKASKLKESLNGLDSKLKERESALTEYTSKEAERAAEAERKAFEKLKSEGKVDEIIADYEKRSTETKAQYEKRIETLMSGIKSEKRNAIVSDLASLATDKGSKAFKRLIADRVEYDPETGKTIFLDDAGRATSLDYEGFKAEILNDDTFESLIKAPVSTTGGLDVNGSGNHSGAGGVPRTLEECKGNRALETAFFNKQMGY